MKQGMLMSKFNFSFSSAASSNLSFKFMVKCKWSFNERSVGFDFNTFYITVEKVTLNYHLWSHGSTTLDNLPHKVIVTKTGHWDESAVHALGCGSCVWWPRTFLLWMLTLHFLGGWSVCRLVCISGPHLETPWALVAPPTGSELLVCWNISHCAVEREWGVLVSLARGLN